MRYTVEKMWSKLPLLLLSALLMLAVACSETEDPPPSGEEGGIVIDFEGQTDPAAEQLLLLQDQLMVLDARLSNPFSAERKEDLLREYAGVFEAYLKQPQTLTETPEQLVGDGYVLCAQADSIGVTAGTARLLEYGSPDEAVYFALQTGQGEVPDAANIYELYSSDVMVANNGAACLYQGEELWVLLINEYKDSNGDGSEVWYTPAVFRGADAASMVEVPLNMEASQAARDYVLEPQLLANGIALRFMDFENNEIGGCELKVVDSEAQFTSW